MCVCKCKKEDGRKNVIMGKRFMNQFWWYFSELNLAVAAYISDSVIDEVINKLSDSHKGLVSNESHDESDKSVILNTCPS